MISLIVYSVVCTIFPSIPRADLRKAHGTLTRMVCHRVGDKPHTALFCDLLHNCRFSDARRADQENGTLLPERNQWKTNFISCKSMRAGLFQLSLLLLVCSYVLSYLVHSLCTLEIFLCLILRDAFLSVVFKEYILLSAVFCPFWGQDSFFRSV